jgi:hypothetical protein
MTRLEALRGLYDAVKAGTFCRNEALSQEEGALIDLCFEPIKGDVEAWEYVSMALSAEISAVGAALALIEATLPGWKVGSLSEFESGLWYARIYQPQGADWPKWTNYPSHEGTADNPGTALLLACIAALIAIKEGKG